MLVLNPQLVKTSGKYNVNAQHAKIKNVKERPLNFSVCLTAIDKNKNIPKRTNPDMGSFPCPNIISMISNIVRKIA